MKRLAKVSLGVIAVLALAVGGSVTYLMVGFPKVGPAPSLKIDATPALLARGKYLADNVSGCIDCHSTRDWQAQAGPVIAGTEGAGGERFGEDLGFPGTFYASNITPAALRDWTDGELGRAITTGVSRDGRALFPVMPFTAFGTMADEDIRAIVAYIRTIPPVARQVPASQANFPINLIMRTFPQPAAPTPVPPVSDAVAYGRYLTNAAGCAECHTPKDKGAPIPGMEFAGGPEFKVPWGSNFGANITPDPETGIGKWDRAAFVRLFKSLPPEQARARRVEKGHFNTLMPWTVYAGMTETDLGAIFDYLQTVTPVKHKVATPSRWGGASRDADSGPDAVDVSRYPPEIQQGYAALRQECGQCHSVARPLNTAEPNWEAFLGGHIKDREIDIASARVQQISRCLQHLQDDREHAKGNRR